MPIVKAPRAQLCDQIAGLSQLIAADLPIHVEHVDLVSEESTEDPEIGEQTYRWRSWVLADLSVIGVIGPRDDDIGKNYALAEEFQ
jgi:hypothetical protein